MGRFLVFFILLLDCIAAGCTYLWGAIVVPNILSLMLWLLDNLGRFLFYLLSWGWLPGFPVLPAWMSTYPYRRPHRGLACAGIFFWLPASIIRCKLYKEWCKQRELTYDEFAYLCSQGEALLRFLQASAVHQVQLLATDYEPSMLERIGHLEALLRTEYEQMAKLGLVVPNLPRIPDSPGHLLHNIGESN